MKRRTVLKRVGIASAGAAAATGSAAAKRTSGDSVSGDVDATIDVSEVSGEVLLADLLSDDQVADLDADASAVRLTVDAGVDEITPAEDCCANGCCESDLDCPFWCFCCRCDNCFPEEEREQ